MSKPKKFAVVLSGCGVFDGAEIHEAILTLFAIVKNGGVYDIFAPDVTQHHVINHITGEEMDDSRNVLVESARIARGKIKPLAAFEAPDYDGLIFPGGYGAAKNLSDFAFAGVDLSINEEVRQAILKMRAAGKPIGALCIAPVLMASLLDSPELTIGQDEGTANAVEKMGATHKQTTHGEVVVDRKNKLVTTPCYMLDATIVQIGEGAENAVKAMFKLM